MVTRFPDWPERLQAFFAARRRQPFAWYLNDCCSFASGAVLAMTGADLMADFPSYRTAEEAGRLFKGCGLETFVDARLPRQEAGLFSRGDVAMIDSDRRRTLAVHGGDRLFGPGLDGILDAPIGGALVCWRV